MTEEEIEATKAPRRSMQEQAFRRYEKWIAVACKGSVLVDPVDLIPPMKPSSFMVGFSDARRGWEEFGYKSTMIPVHAELRRIKVYETKDGKVLLENKYADKMSKMAQKVKDVSLIIKDQKITWKSQVQEIVKEIWLDSKQHEEIEKVFQQLAKHEFSPYEVAVLVRPESVQWLQDLQKKWSPLVDIEELQEGWWRLTC